MATITQINFKDNARNISTIREKEIIKGYKSVIIDGEKAGKELLDVRFYMSRSSRASNIYCIVWIKDDKTGEWFSGKGKAGGYGYDKRSASLADALENAGVIVKGLAGVGETAELETLRALSSYLTDKKFIIVDFWG